MNKITILTEKVLLFGSKRLNSLTKKPLRTLL